MPYPICMKHASRLYMVMKDSIHLALRKSPEERAQAVRDTAEAERINREMSVVYYLRIAPGIIKIGCTRNLKERVRQLRQLPSDVMAAEPGSYPMEKTRHKQFAHLRPDARENFRDAPELLAHIAAVAEVNGPPDMSGVDPTSGYKVGHERAVRSTLLTV